VLSRYLTYLWSHDLRLPTTDSFFYSRRELFRRGLLKRATISDVSACMLRRVLANLPSPLQRTALYCYRALRRTLSRAGTRLISEPNEACLLEPR